MKSGDDNSVKEEKKALRKEIRAKLKALTKEEIQEQSAQVWKRLFDLPQYKESKSVGMFLSMPSGEINTDLALKDCTSASPSKKKLYVPQVGANFEHADMELIEVVMPPHQQQTTNERELFYHNWPRNKWNIPEPPKDMPLRPAKPGDLDLIVVPGLAFDRFGNRLGQGKGYYDRFLARITANDAKKPYLVGVALECQLLPSSVIPTNEYDFPLDMVLFPNEMIQPSEKK